MEQPYLQFNSWYDIKDSNLSPIQTGMWENLIEMKEIIDQVFSDIEEQIINFRSLGIDYTLQLENFDEGFRSYIIDNYVKQLYNINNYFDIPYIEDIVVLPTETEKVFKILYTHFFATQIEETVYYLNINNFDDFYKSSNFDMCKRIVVQYYDTLINSFAKLINFISNRNNIKKLNEKINEYGFVKEVIQSTDSAKVAEFFKKSLESLM